MEHSKHAYLIMIHQDSFVVRTLLRMLDDERNDIYIHIDKKSKDVDEKVLLSFVNRSKVCFVKREKVFWGHISMVKAEYNLYAAAFESGGYSYYHLLSGADLPIKTQDEIHNFFDKNNGRDFLSFANNEMTDRIIYRHLFPRHHRGGCTSKHWLGRKVNRCQEMIVNWFVNFQKKHNLKILAFPIYKKGTQWASLTGECVELLLKNRDKVLSSFRFAKCPDEHYKQTVLYNELKRVREQCDYQQLQNSLNNCDEDISQAARFIDWSRGTLNFTTRDWNRILESKDMFCRKIADKDLAAMIFGHFGPQQ